MIRSIVFPRVLGKSLDDLQPALTLLKALGFAAGNEWHEGGSHGLEMLAPRGGFELIAAPDQPSVDAMVEVADADLAYEIVKNLLPTPSRKMGKDEAPASREGLTIRNTELAFWAGYKNLTGSSGLTVKKCRIENVGRAIYSDWSGSKDFYIADNVMIGKFRSDILMGFTGRTWQNLPEFANKLVSEYGVKVYGQGHVVAYNSIAQFHDGIDIATYGNPDGSPNPIHDRMPVSIDFYNNDISNVEDNCIESDGGAHNIRIFRNRCFNHGHRALSVQPMFGGPVYFIRNIVYHAPEGGAVKFTASSAGIVVYHNTLIAPVKPMLLAASNVHYRNNLILGKSETLETFAVETNTNYSSSDYNGFRPNEGAEFSFEWSSPPVSTRAVFPGEMAKLSTQQQAQLEARSRETRRYKTLKEFADATGQDKHSILVDFDVFQKVTPPGADPRTLYKPADFDFQLRPGSVAVDAGTRLPGVNDDFTGRAPDLGAYEVGRPVPHYGPR